MSTESIWEDLRRDLPWKKEDVRKIINPFAEDTSDNLFKAIHCTSDLSIATEPGKTSENLNQLEEDDYHEKTMENLLEEFLSPDRERVLTAIIGGVGCGKSHLVHWMRLFITDPKYVLINVKKSGTSLREIVRQIIEKLPQDKQQDFLSEFNNTGDLLASRENQIRELLNQIALAIKEDKGKDTPEQVKLRNVKSTEEKDWEDELILTLPDLFQDVEYGKRSFSKEDGVIAKIADHIFSPSSPEDRPEALAKFCRDDFPTDNSVYMSAAESARAAIDNIKGAVNEKNEQIGPDYATNIVNRNLEFAIARCLKFSADRLEQLMRELRLYLKTQQKELVI